MSPPEYILDPRFEVHLLAAYDITWDAPRILLPEEIHDFLAQYPPEETICCSYNALFDSSILSWRYNWVAARLVDPLGMARALRTYPRYSLGAVAKELFGHDSKGDVLPKVKGLSVQGIKNAGLWPQYRTYAMQDARLCMQIYLRLASEFPEEEAQVMDLVLRCAIQPVLHANVPLLQTHLEELRRKKQRLLNDCGYDKAALMSTVQFKEALESLGVEIRTKLSATNKLVPQFAKSDPFMQELLEYNGSENDDVNYQVQTLAAARLSFKSTIEETRAERFLNIGKLHWPNNEPMMPVPLRYAGAHTGRLSGEFGMNLQNLPRDKTKSKLRAALCAPPGHKLITADLAQIEARIVALFCGQDALVDAFRNGEDVYASFASIIFGKPVNKKDNPGERFIGKTCIAEKTLVYTDRGLVPVEQIQLTDKVWDGDGWVGHGGVISNGLKQTLQLCGVWLTPDHLVWSGTQWKPASFVVTEKNTLFQALASAAANLPSLATYGVIQSTDSQGSLSNVLAVGRNFLSTRIISNFSKVLGAISAQNLLLNKNVGGNTRPQCLTMNTVPVSLTGWPHKSYAVTAQLLKFTKTTAVAELLWPESGETIDQYFCNMYRRFQDGITQRWKLIASTITAITNRVISVSVQLKKIATTDELSLNSELKLFNSKRRLPVYDILSTGPKNRFLIHTSHGPLLVHNCILGLGYGCGPDRFYTMVTTQAKQYSIPLEGLFDPRTAEMAVNTYRSLFSNIQNMWRRLDRCLAMYINGGHEGFVPMGPIAFGTGTIKLPNGMTLRYELHDDKLYGAKLLENIVQALARIVIMQAALRLAKRGYRFILQGHDELLFAVPESAVDEAKMIIAEEMIREPEWMPGLPLAMEIGVGDNYGETK